jgi:hypothetical protein
MAKDRSIKDLEVCFMRRRTGSFNLSFFHLRGRLGKRLGARSFQISSGVIARFERIVTECHSDDVQDRTIRQLVAAMHEPCSVKRHMSKMLYYNPNVTGKQYLTRPHLPASPSNS